MLKRSVLVVLLVAAVSGCVAVPVAAPRPVYVAPPPAVVVPAYRPHHHHYWRRHHHFHHYP